MGLSRTEKKKNKNLFLKARKTLLQSPLHYSVYEKPQSSNWYSVTDTVVIQYNGHHHQIETLANCPYSPWRVPTVLHSNPNPNSLSLPMLSSFTHQFWGGSETETEWGAKGNVSHELQSRCHYSWHPSAFQAFCFFLCMFSFHCIPISGPYNCIFFPM